MKTMTAAISPENDTTNPANRARWMAEERAARWERATGPARAHIARMREIAGKAEPVTYTVSPAVPFDPYE